MIRTLRQGKYKLIVTKKHIKILYLDENIYAWPDTKEYGEMLVVSYRQHKTDAVLSRGRYYLYDVIDEENLNDNYHLELEVGKDKWQGYLLLTGLPDDKKLRGKIIPTHEVITSHKLVNI